MNRKTKTFHLLMLMMILLAVGFADNLDTIVSTTIFIAVCATLSDMIRSTRFLKSTSAIFSIFSIIYTLTMPHFSVLEEVYGLALNSEKITDTNPYSVALLYGTGTLVVIFGTGIKFFLIKRVHKKLNH